LRLPECNTGAWADIASSSTLATLTYRTVEVDGLALFYREAGPRDAPTILPLHGFPSSSRMYDTLLPLLADRYHLVAPDYPGFGHSDAPSPDSLVYTFGHLAEVIGMRLAVRHPERVRAIIIQNAVSHEEGLGPLWEARKAFWLDRAAHEEKVMSTFTSIEVARQRHVGRSPRPERYNPDNWTDEAAMLSRPEQGRIQSDLFYDYRSNVAAYPVWSGLAGLAACAPAANAGGVGTLRSVLHRRWRACLCPRRARRRDPHSRRRTFCTRSKLDDIATLVRDFLDRHLEQGACDRVREGPRRDDRYKGPPLIASTYTCIRYVSPTSSP
jgi:pimeloyl-ACP methyl ester carboxylesterase